MTQAAKNALDTRYRLLDYLYTALHAAKTDGTPVLRPLWYAFPHDPATFAIDTQFLFGPSVLVSPVLASLVNDFNSSSSSSELDRAKTELSQVKDIMVQNVEQILSRGERIELLVDKTDNMASQATAFRRGARTVRRQQFWRNQKIMVLSGLVGLVVLWLVVAQFCGAGLNQCGANNN